MFGSGIGSADSSDRVHYLMEAIKTLGQKKDADGNPILSQDEVRKELGNISTAYRLYDNLAGYLDNIAPSYNMADAKLYKLAKAHFGDAVFRESMQMVFHKQNLESAQSSKADALGQISNQNFNLIDLSNQIETINNRIDKIKSLQIGEDIRDRKVKYLETRRGQIEKLLNSEKESLGVRSIAPADPSLTVANDNLLTAEMHMDDTQTRYNRLLKVKSFNSLKSWFETTAQEEALNDATEKESQLRDVQSQEASDILAGRSAFDQLDEDQQKVREEENRAILTKVGFTEEDLNNMSYEERESTANDVLTTQAAGNKYVNPGLYLNLMSNLKNQEGFDALFARPDFSNFLTNNLPNVTRQTPYQDVVRLAKEAVANKNRPKEKKQRPVKGVTSRPVSGRKKAANDIRTVSQLQKDIKVSKGVAKQSDVLQYIIDSDFATPPEKELARQFLELTDSNDILNINNTTLESAGEYNTKGSKVSINLTFMGEDYVDAFAAIENVVLHELVHKYTVNAFNNVKNSDLASRITTLFNYVSDQARKRGDFDKFYGLTNTYEFISEAMSSPEFQEYLKGITYQNTRVTAWEEFLNLVNQLLKSLGINTNQTALDEAISLTTQLIGQERTVSFTGVKSALLTRLQQEITTKKTPDENLDAAADFYEELYDNKTLTPAELENLKQLVDEFVTSTNNTITKNDKTVIKLGEFNFKPGNFIVLKSKNATYTVEGKTPEGGVTISYVFVDPKTKEKKASTRDLTDGKEIAGVFENKAKAIAFIKSRATKAANTTVEVAAMPNDAFGSALQAFVDYTQQNFKFGTLDPKLLELGNNLIKEAVKLGKNNFPVISQEILNRVGRDTYKKIFGNLRAIYVALFADYKGSLTDVEGDMTKLVMGQTTADSMISTLQPTEVEDQKFTGGGVENPQVVAKNIEDKVSGRLLKSTGQQFLTDKEGVWTSQIDSDPVKTRYYNFLQNMQVQTRRSGKTMTQMGFKGMLIQDSTTPVNGITIPHEQNTLDYIARIETDNKKAKLGQIVIVTDLNQNPLKFNQSGELDESGDYIVFNIESEKTVTEKNPEIVSNVNNLTLDQAKQSISNAANTVKIIREKAAAGGTVVLDLSPNPGVPVFTKELNSMTPVASHNFQIEIATVRKDDSNIAYFVNHPNNTGLIGGAYVFINDIPVKIEPKKVSSSTADLIVTILDQQDSNTLELSELKARTRFLNDLIYQKFSSDPNQASFYFKGKDVYVNGAKAIDRKEAILANARYNVSSPLLNNNFTPYVLRDGKITRSKPVSYNAYLLNRAETKAALNPTGDQILGNAYFNYTVDRQIEKWQNPTQAKVEPIKPAEKVVPVKGLDKSFVSEGKQITTKDFLAQVDLDETGVDNLDVVVKGATLYIKKLDVSADGSRSGVIFIDKGSSLGSGSLTLDVVFKPLPTNIVESPVEETKIVTKPSATNNKKEQLLEKLRQKSAEAKANAQSLDKDIEDTMTSLGRSVDLDSDLNTRVSQDELDWFAKTFAKSYSGDFARELRITNSVINSNLWGQFTENGVRLYKDAPQGTLYHESFHEFSQIYLTKAEKKDLYNSARKSIPSLSDKTDFEVEEYLAEEFRNYALNDGKYKVTPKVGNIFQRIWNYIKNILFGPVGIDGLFDKLYKGKVKDYVPNINNIQFKKLNAGIQDALGNSLFNATQSITVVKSIDRLIYDFIHSYNKSVVDVMTEPKILEAAYKFAYRTFNNKLATLRDKAIEKITNSKSDEELAQIESDLVSQEKLFTNVTNNWNDIMNYHQKHSNTFVIKGGFLYFTYDEEGNILEENDDSQLIKAKNAFDSVSGNEISSIDGANKETKALIRGLGKATANGPVINEFGIQELVDFGSTWNNLAINLAGTMELDQMFNKLMNLKSSFPEYNELLEKLNAFSNRDSLTINQVSQLAKFRQDFSKSYIGIYELVFDPATGLYKFTEATKSNVKAIEDEFTNNFITSSVNDYISKDQYGTNQLTSKIRELKIDTKEARIAFLKAIGIKLSEGTINSPKLETVVTGKAIAAIKNALVTLVDNGVAVTDPIEMIRRPNEALKLPGEAGNIDAILKLESNFNRNNASASMINADGNNVYALSLNNMLTISNAYLSDPENYPTYQDVIAQAHMQHLDIENNPYVRNSVWLNQMFNLDENSPTFGQRKLIGGKPVLLTVVNFNGLSVKQEQGASEGTTTTNLWIGDKLVQDFNALLTSGTKEMMRAGDKSSAFAVRIDGYTQETGREDRLPVKISDFETGFGGLQALSIFRGYLVDELLRIDDRIYADVGQDLDYYSESAKNFSLFRDILDEETKKSMISDLDTVGVTPEQIISKYENKLKEGLRNYFNKQVKDKIDSFSNYQFDPSNPLWVDKGLTSQYKMDQLLRAYVVNAFILNVEQTKIFNGDGAFYKAFHKRNSKDSSTGTTLMTDKWFLDWINKDPNTNLQSKDLGVNNPVTNITNTVVFKDNVKPSAYVDIYRKQLTELGVEKSKVDSIVEKYKENNEGDAQGWITLDFYRTFKLAQGKWFPEHEKIYAKASRGEQLTADEMFYFMPIKAQYAGPLQYEGAFAPAFHKFSLVPLLPSVIKGTKMESMNEKMIRNNVGYGLFASGSKVATILGENGKENFYDNYENRTPVNATDAFGALNPIFNHYLKEQVNIDPYLHDEVIFGTQFRKLLFQNLFNNGKAVDEKWDALYNQYSDVINDLITNEKQRLLEELGVEETPEGTYKNVDFTKLVDKFVKEARRRNMNSNVTEFIEYDKSTNSFKYPLDASVNRQQIQNMIMSIINNRLVRQHMNGDLMIQVAGSGFEKYEKPTDAQVEEYGTNGLRFYHVKDGKTRSMQVKVPLTGEFENLLYFKHNDGEKIGNRERLNEMLTNEQWMNENRKAVTMIGYRIPTQGLNSIEFMEVAEFLPSEVGNVLILPTEIVTKAGSDFDIDKLSIFKPSIRTRYTVNKQTQEKEISEAYYVQPAKRNLKTSIEDQKEKLTAAYTRESEPIKDRINKIKDNKYLDTRWYQELKNELRSKLNAGITDEIDRLMEINHEIKRLSLEMTFAKSDRSEFLQSKRVSELTQEEKEQLANLNNIVNSLYDQQQRAYEQRNQQQILKRNAFQLKGLLLGDAERVINDYMDRYYAQVNNLYENLNNLQAAYFNELEELRTFKAGLQNRIIEIGTEVLQDKGNFEQLITPNDTGLIKPIITKEGEIKQRNGYPLATDYTGTAIYTEKTQEEKFLAGLVGKKALGIAAVNNTFTQLFEIIGLKVNNTYVDSFGKVRETNIRLLDKLQKEGFDFANSYDEAGVLKSEFISQMINAYVDVLNDDFIFYANAGLDVAPIIFYLKNAGVKTEKIFYFINHPVIKYFINNTQATKSNVLKALYPMAYDSATRTENGLPSFKNQLFKNIVGASNSKIELVRQDSIIKAQKHPEFFEEKYLLGQISKPIEQISYDERSAILGHFLQVQQQADLLRKFQSAHSYDTKTAPNPVDSRDFSLLEQEVSDSKFIDDKYQKAISNTVIKPYNVTQVVSDMFDNLMPATLNKRLVESLAVAKESFDSDVQDRYVRLFTNDILLYVFSNYVRMPNLTDQPTAFDYVNGNDTRTSMFQLNTVTRDGKQVKLDGRLSTRVRNFKNNPQFEELRNRFPIINQLRVDLVKKTDGFSNVYIYRGENTTDTQNSLIEQFSNLANFSDPNYTPEQQKIVRKLFRDLALFGFLQSGLNKSPISFTDIIPNELYTPLVQQGLKAFQDDIQNRGFSVVMAEYRQAFNMNNPEIFGNKPAIPSYRYKNYRITKSTKEEIKENDQPLRLFYGGNPNEVNYSLKASNIILDNLLQIKKWESNKSINNETLYRKIQDLGIPKEQIELLKASNGSSVEQKLASFMADYSYTIEINTAKRPVYTKDLNDFGGQIHNFTYQGLTYEADFRVDKYMKYDPTTDESTFISKEEYQNVFNEFSIDKTPINTDYYTGLTVPGGTNYEENEIATSAIEPSIKGHAQFSTDNGIGWFRSDEKIVPGSEGRLQDDGAGGLVRTSISSKNVRRILELQSDLFQKGRNESNLIKNDELKKVEFELDFVDPFSDEERINNLLNRQYKLEKQNSLQNSFLQLLNKDNNWITFFVKSIIQDSAKKGYEQVLFPSGDTASKIEGHTTLEDFKREKTDRIQELKKIANNTEVIEKGWFYKIQENKIITKENYNTKEQADEALKSKLLKISNEIKQLEQEIERVEIEGFGALRPIYNFYETTVSNILKKQGYNPVEITDEYGNKWSQVAITQNSKDLILFYGGSPAEKLVVPEENRILYSKYSIETQTSYDNINTNIDNIIDKLGLNQRCD